MEQYDAAKRQSRVLKEADLADQLKFSAAGKRGQTLLQNVAGLKRRAGEQEQRKKELLDFISANWTDGQRADDVETAILEYESLVESLPEEIQAIRSRVPVLGRLTSLSNSLDQIEQSVTAGSWREAEAERERLDLDIPIEHPDDQQAYEAILQRHHTLSGQVAALRQQEIADLRGSIAESEEEGDWDAVKSCAGKLLELCPDEHDVSEVAQRAELEQNRINFVSAALDAFEAAKYTQCLASCSEAMNLAGGDVKIESESFSGPISKLRDMAEKKLKYKANASRRRKRNVLMGIAACILIGIAGLLAKEGYIRHAYRARVAGFKQAVHKADQQAADALSAWLIAQSGDGWRRAYPVAVAYRDAIAEMTAVQKLMQLARNLSSNKAHPDVWREIEQDDKAAIEKLSALDFAGAIAAYQSIARKLKPIVQYGAVQVEVDVPEYAQSFYSEATKRLQIGDEAWQTHAAFPIKLENLLAKSHEVRLQVSGFRTEPSTALATVRDGQTETVRFTLTPEPALVTVHANVPGAEVFDASGARLGAVGSPIEFPSRRELTITLRAAGFVDKTEQIEALDSGKNYTYSFVLKEVPIPRVGRNWVSPSTGMEFVWIEALKIWVGKYEVTNGEYRRKEAGHNSMSYEKHSLNGDRQPVVWVNFDRAKAYAAWLTGRDKAQLGGLRYRLPSEQEFMTYAQCGDGREYPWGSNWPPRSGQAGNYEDDTAKLVFSSWTFIAGYNDGHPVTCDVEKSWANPWGLYGVGGNVWEVCASDSSGGSYGARRGASWNISGQAYMRCGCSSGHSDTRMDDESGFRLVLSR